MITSYEMSLLLQILLKYKNNICIGDLSIMKLAKTQLQQFILKQLEIFELK